METIEGPTLREASTTCEYDIVGQKNGIWARALSGLTDPDGVRAMLEHYRRGSPSVTWAVVRRITTVVEDFDDELARP